VTNNTYVCAEDDHERLCLVEKTKSGKWIVDESVSVRQVKDDVVKFTLHSPINRYSLLLILLLMLLIMMIMMIMI